MALPGHAWAAAPLALANVTQANTCIAVVAPGCWEEAEAGSACRSCLTSLQVTREGPLLQAASQMYAPCLIAYFAGMGSAPKGSSARFVCKGMPAMVLGSRIIKITLQ